MAKNIIIITAVVITLIAIGATALYIIQRQEGEEVKTGQEVATIPEAPEQQVNTSDWKVYRNEEYRFEMKYPPEWKVEEDKKSIVFRALKAPQTELPPLVIEIIENPNCIPLEELREHFPPEYFEVPENEFSVRYINGKLFYEFFPYITFAGEKIGVFVEDKYVLKIRGFYNETLISTFKFWR
jgi:hypothetical protein